ncbi:MAG: class I poly(R)-hydroxyalkanoic acid synthase [Burkholderiales bacterium]|nr:class I poly(R)-hydroxyalkanoic acid synthase [Burkholderiales bacterium]
MLRAIAGAANQVTQGWMPLAEMAAAIGAHGEAALWAPALARNPEKLAQIQRRWAEAQAALWSALLAGRSPDAPQPRAGDRRFAAREWRENPYYEYLWRSYLLAARFAAEAVEAAELEGKAKERLRFAVRQWVDALSPANFAATNPEVLRAALASRGESLARGLANLLADVRAGRIRQTDESAFEVGRNLAVTPGDVVYENELMQLIQYAPTTPEVSARPLVMVPPCINKYYILDLRPENSFVRYAVGEGHTVFMVSWRNVGPAQGGFGWDDYLRLGVFEALRVAREIVGAERANALGFCVGGTLLAAALAVMAAQGEDAVESVTWLTTLLDFEEPGELGLFVDEQSVRMREATIGAGGILSGAELAFVFSALRANDLVWPYVVNNYLKGGEPPAFDLLYWNADSTNLPGPMYCQYVRSTYLENRLREPGALVCCGVPVDLGRIERPSFVLATREDHIVPWRSAYRSLYLLGGEKTFVLGASGHVAGVVNPAATDRRSYWIGEAGDYPQDPEVWLAGAKERPGSWWKVWAKWLDAHRGGLRPAPERTGSARYRPIEPAPGRYVKEKARPQGG